MNIQNIYLYQNSQLRNYKILTQWQHGRKKSRSSKESTSKRESKDKRFESLENKFYDRLYSMMELIRESLGSLTGSNTTNQYETDAREAHSSHDMYRDAGCSATLRPEDKITFQENSNGMRPISIIPLESDVVIERTIAVSVVDFSIAQSRFVGGLESNTNDNVDKHSVEDLKHEDVNNNKHKSFQNFLTYTEKEITLNYIFGKEITGKDTDSIGILLDLTQEEVLSKSLVRATRENFRIQRRV